MLALHPHTLQHFDQGLPDGQSTARRLLWRMRRNQSECRIVIIDESYFFIFYIHLDKLGGARAGRAGTRPTAGQRNTRRSLSLTY